MPLEGKAKLDYMRRRYRENPQRQIAYSLAYDRRRRKTDPNAYRNNALRRRYGITLQQFNAIIEAQKVKCALCEESLKLGTKSVHVDHCHETGRVRGILCARCNLGIGKFGDTISGLEKAIAYLKRGLSGG